MNKTSCPSRGLSDKQNSNKNVNAPSLRLYQVWKGNNIFALGGRLIFGPDARSLYLTISLIVVPVILFCSLVSQTLVDNFPNNLGPLLVAIPAVFTVYILVLIFLVSARDPGIIPRNPPNPDLDDDWDACSMSTDWAASGRYLPPTKSVNVNGMVVRVKFCQTCMLYRPPRCSHCSVCNNCVDRFDHHCPWVGQCIGKRNYLYFFMFVSSTALLCLYVFAMCWVNIILIMNAKNCSLWEAFMKSPASGILISYTFTVSWFVGGLSVFHLYLVITNQTTYENFRYRYERRMNPYNHGCASNIKDVLFSKIPPSQHKFRSFVKPEWYSQYNSSRYFAYAFSGNYTKKSYDTDVSYEGSEFDLERCETHQTDHSGKWSNGPELHRLASKFIAENVTREKSKKNGGL
ncbi:probable protein S-acyltransferase 7 [Cynara cardunculus var. scolymus]|uniref:probable protein S-acyltransferase 7 n=1 Tax=Cynara cardunculus var. scolymus TaxID=59895 RepID=UPI000D624CB5|nr:probable protein S-acyltransferase 7 [Cynara cardunculus var. scolymus]